MSAARSGCEHPRSLIGAPMPILLTIGATPRPQSGSERTDPRWKPQPRRKRILRHSRPRPRSRSKLTQDQKDIREWVHGFAEQTVRPAASEWDEREQTPWPVIQEAAKIGLYGFEGIAQFWLDETGILFPIVNEESFLGRRRDRYVDHGHDPGCGRDPRQRHPRTVGRVDPALLRGPSRSRRWRRSASPSPTPVRMSPHCARGLATTRPRTNGF